MVSGGGQRHARAVGAGGADRLDRARLAVDDDRIARGHAGDGGDRMFVAPAAAAAESVVLRPWVPTVVIVTASPSIAQRVTGGQARSWPRP